MWRMCSRNYFYRGNIDRLETLKNRYAKGELTKGGYEKMKKELEEEVDCPGCWMNNWCRMGTWCPMSRTQRDRKK